MIISETGHAKAVWASLMIAFLCLQSTAALTAENIGARLAVPSPEQLIWQDYEIGMFIHFSMNTWQDQEYDDLGVPLSEFNPDRLDTDQWAQTAVDMGAKYVVFVAKHVGGFCMWPTKTTDYAVQNTPWRNGKGDVLADLSDSCRKHGLRLGVYLSPADRKHGATVGGRCSSPDEQDRYAALYREQLTEILSQYGEMVEVWFDGSLVVEVGDILARYAPRAMVFQGPYATIRWVGNESGFAPYPAWNSVRCVDGESGIATAANGDPLGAMWLPLECDARMRRDWFWSGKNADTLKSVDELMEMYYLSVGRGATLLLNHTPDTTGLIPEADAKRSREFGLEVKRRFGRSLAETNGIGASIELELNGTKRIDHVITMEDTAFGERVLEYAIEGLNGGTWQTLCEGTSVGHKRIDGFKPIEVSKIRFRAVKAQAPPIIRKLAAYDTGGASIPERTNVSIWSPKADLAQEIILWQWGGPSGGDAQTVSLDVGQYCRHAGLYRLEFRPGDSSSTIPNIESLEFLIDGLPASEFLKQVKGQPSEYRVNVSGIDRRMDIQFNVPKGSGKTGQGKLIFQLIPPDSK